MAGLTPAMRWAIEQINPTMKELKEIIGIDKDIEQLRNRIIGAILKENTEQAEITQRVLLKKYGYGSEYHKKYGKYVEPITGKDIQRKYIQKQTPYIIERQKMLPGKRAENIFMDLQ